MRAWILLVAISGCGRYGFSDVDVDGQVAATDGAVIDAAPIDPVADWADPSYPYRYRVTITNELATARAREPIFLDGASFTGGAEPIRETALRLVCRDGEINVDMPFALHDWSSDALPMLDDADGDVDGDDRLLFLVDLPASGTVDCFLYYDVEDRAPIGFPAVSVTPVEGGAFSRVTVDGVTANATALRVTDGATTFDLELEPSIPLWNESSTYTYESSRLGPRIDDLTLPDGTVVMTTANHSSPDGPLAQTIRLGPLRIDGSFELLGDNGFFQPHLVESVPHSAARAWSRPIASVVVLDTELYCEGDSCVPARDAGDVRLVGYLFDRGDVNEVLMRWQVEASVNGPATIEDFDAAAETEHFALVSYIIEQYAESDFPADIDIDTLRWRTPGGALDSFGFDPGHSGGDDRANAEVEWAMMTDTDSPFTGSVAIIPEGVPRVNGADVTWRAGYWDDGRGISEPNGYQSEWNLYAPGFDTWGSANGHSGAWAYWIWAFAPPDAGPDSDPVIELRERLANPPMQTSATFEML